MLRLRLPLIVLLLAPAAARAELPDGHWQLLTHAVPPTLAPGAQVEVEVTLQNRTALTWSEEKQDRLAYHWRNLDGSVLEWDGARTQLPAPLPPGQQVRLLATVRAPTTPGRYYLQFEPVREHRRWWGPASFTHDLLIPVEVVASDAELAWSIDPPPPLPPLAAGEQIAVPLRLRNTGDTTWSPAAGDRLTYHWQDADGRRSEGIRTALPGPVAPNTSVELSARLEAPPTPGTYTLEWEPVREHVRWLGPPTAGERSSTTTIGPARDRIEVEAELPELHARSVSELDVLVTNRGDDWPEDHGLALSYHWRDATGQIVDYDGLRTPLPPLARDEEVIVDARVQGPPTAGPHTLEWAAIRENIGWYETDPPAVLPVDVLPPLLAWELRAADWPWTLPVGREELVHLRIHNTGTATLSPRTADRLSYRWRSPDGIAVGEDGLRSELPGDIPPGTSASVTLRVAGPTQTGPYTLELGLVRENVAWAATPSAGLPISAAVFVTRRSDLAQLLLLAATLALVVQARRRRLGPAALRRLPVLWSWAATLVLGLSFADLAGLPPWRGGLAISVSAASLPALLVLATPGRARPTAAFLLSLLTAALLFADLLYMQLLGSIVPVQALIASHQVGDIGGSIAALSVPAHRWLAVPALAGLLLALAWPRVPRDSSRQTATPRGHDGRDSSPRAATLALALLAPLPFAIAMAAAMAGPLGDRVFSEQHNVGRFGVIGAHAFDVLRTARERLFRSELTPLEHAAIANFFLRRPPPPPDPGFAVAHNANLLLIQAEALQGWVIGAQIDGQPVTPFLNQLRDRALTYHDLADETAQGMTSDAEYAVLNSQLPLGQGAVAFLRADNHFLTLAHVLRDHGYSTLSAHPFKKGFWNRAVLHPRYGFQRSLFSEELGPGPTVGWGLADDAFFRRMLPELAATPRPFFAFLVTLSLHHPYDHFPADLKRLQLGALEGSALGNYLHGVHHLDRSLAELFTNLADAGLADNTVIAIYGDHDSRLPLTPELLRLAGITAWSPAVPLQLDRIAGLVVLPKGPVHGGVSTVGGHIDLAPTLLHYLGIPAPRSFAGAVLLPGQHDPGFAVFADGSAIGEGRAFVTAGRGIPSAGACFEHPSWRPLPLAACKTLTARAQQTLTRSRAVADHDLARSLSLPLATGPSP